MKNLLLLIPISFMLGSCSSTALTRPGIVSAAASSDMQHVINVSSYDPKERQRSGRSFSENDVSSLKENGASALIARAGKGGNLDDKCAAFIASADRAGMLPGLYYRVQKQVDPVKQADQFVDRAIWLARGRRWDAPALLLCGDYDGNLPLSSILKFMDRVESRTGVVPVAYLENSQKMKLKTARADRETRIRLRRAPYWLALYSHTSGAATENPRALLDQYRLWNDWSLWQYGGVDWERGHSKAKVYSHERYQFDHYFGDMDRPIERNVFSGSESDLSAFWQRHGLKLR